MSKTSTLDTETYQQMVQLVRDHCPKGLIIHPLNIDFKGDVIIIDYIDLMNSTTVQRTIDFETGTLV